MGDSNIPQVFKIGSYWVYFWTNEGDPLEPVHVHVSEGCPTAQSTIACKFGACPQTLRGSARQGGDLSPHAPKWPPSPPRTPKWRLAPPSPEAPICVQFS